MKAFFAILIIISLASSIEFNTNNTDNIDYPFTNCPNNFSLNFEKLNLSAPVKRGETITVTVSGVTTKDNVDLSEWKYEIKRFGLVF